MLRVNHAGRSGHGQRRGGVFVTGLGAVCGVVERVRQWRSMRVGLMVVVTRSIEVHAGHEAIRHVGVHAIVTGVRLPLDGIAEMCHGRERHRDGRGSDVVGIGVGSGHGCVRLGGAVRVKENLVGSWVGRVGKQRRSVRAFPVIVRAGVKEVVLLHGRRVLALRWESLGGGSRLGLVRLGRGGAFRLGGRLGLLLRLGVVRGSSTALEVFEAALKLLAVVALGNAVLYPSALSKIGDLGPVLVGVGRAAEGAAGAMTGVLARSLGSGRVGVVRL